MKNAFALSLAAMAILFLITVFSLVKTQSIVSLTPVSIESYTAGSFDQPQIHKIYRLSPSDDPSNIPRDDFEQNGHTYHLLELKRDEDSGEILYTAIFGEIKTPYWDTTEMTTT